MDGNSNVVSSELSVTIDVDRNLTSCLVDSVTIHWGWIAATHLHGVSVFAAKDRRCDVLRRSLNDGSSDLFSRSGDDEFIRFPKAPRIRHYADIFRWRHLHGARNSSFFAS